MDCVDYIYIQKNVSCFYIADPSVFFFGKWPPWVSSTKINFFYIYFRNSGKRGGLKLSALHSGWVDPGYSPG